MTRFEILSECFRIIKQKYKIFDGIAPANTNDAKYVVIGQTQETLSADLSQNSRNFFVTFDLWSSYNGKKEVYKMADKIENMLWDLGDLSSLLVVRDSSGYYHGILEMQFIIEKGD